MVDINKIESFLSLVINLLELLWSYLTSSLVASLLSLFAGATLSALVGYFLNSKRNQLVALSSLQDEVVDNKQKTTDVVVNLCHDLQSRAYKDSRYTWPSNEFSITAYKHICTHGISDKFPTGLFDRIELHYSELEKNNQALREREREKISKEPIGWGEAIQGVDAGLVADILIMCSREHADTIIAKETNDGDRLSNDIHIAAIFGQAFGQEEAISKLKCAKGQPLLEKVFEYEINQSRYWEYSEDKTIDELIENLENQTQRREKTNFDDLSESIENEIMEYNWILRRLFL
ncbi:hypothetical protein BVU17_17880 (plasmid) [Haloarcula taiwanensis]|uniref:Uncharacterized protein n=1 Tax=Haloarcula taiwanensis TaxID=1932004 RepID=A0A2H5A3X0_9EURY|nr:hypothetical protein [Haloarcula taiwanensis]AUG49449.1 hypothetical protein BVU17_17880 [Haloarcula taiwanensis]